MTEHVIEKLQQDVESLKIDVASLKLSQAVGAERYKHIDERLMKIDTTLSRLMWIVLSGIGTGVVAFIVSGGLAPPPGL